MILSYLSGKSSSLIKLFYGIYKTELMKILEPKPLPLINQFKLSGLIGTFHFRNWDIHI